MSLITATNSVQTNSIEPIASNGTMTIGTTRTNNVGTVAITMGRANNIVKIGGSLQVDKIDAVPTGILNIGIEDDTEEVNIKNGQIRALPSFATVNSIFFSTGTSDEAFIDTKIETPLYIAPNITLNSDALCNALNLGNTAIPVNIDASIFKLNIDTGGGYGTLGQVLLSGGAGTCSWSENGTIVRSGETTVGAMTSAVTGTITYVTAFATKPKIQLTMNLNGTGTTIIPVAVSSHTIVSGQYAGFTWITGTTSSTATISWYATI